MFKGSVVWRGVVYSILMTIGKLVCGLWLVRVPNPFGKLQYLARLIKGPVQGARKAGADARTSAGRQLNAPKKPLAIYPGLILGCAMVSRGEIGYLISSLAEGHGVFSQGSSKRASASEEPSEIFLIVTWAITLCTIAGPVSMGFLVGRVRKLEAKLSEQTVQEDRANVLGSWGVS